MGKLLEISPRQVTVTIAPCGFVNEADNRFIKFDEIALTFDAAEWPTGPEEQRDAIEDALINYAADNLDEAEDDDWSHEFSMDAVTIDEGEASWVN